MAAAADLIQSNQDVLGLIFDYLTPEFVSVHAQFYDQRGLLLALALTCQAFKQPALDALWKCLDRVYPLLMLLPTKGYAVVDPDSGDEVTQFRLEGPISDDQMVRFKYYAGRVRAFSGFHADEKGDWTQVYQSLMEIHPTPVFPAINHIFLLCPPSKPSPNFPYILHLINYRSVKRLQIPWVNMPWYNEVVKPAIDVLSAECSGVTHMDLAGTLRQPDVLALLRGAPELAYFKFIPRGATLVDGELVEALSRCRKLESLYLDLCLGSVGEFPTHQSQSMDRGRAESRVSGLGIEKRMGFKSLKHLQVLSRSRPILALFSYLEGNTSLETLSLLVAAPDEIHITLPLLVPSLMTFTVLQRLDLLPATAWKKTTFDHSVLMPLLGLPELEVVTWKGVEVISQEVNKTKRVKLVRSKSQG